MEQAPVALLQQQWQRPLLLPLAGEPGEAAWQPLLLLLQPGVGQVAVQGRGCLYLLPPPPVVPPAPPSWHLPAW
jgi:hypothetical protein